MTKVNTYEQLLVRAKNIYEKYVIRKGDDECWDWKGGKDARGYGRTRAFNKTMGAYRLSWILHNGEIPDGLLICHNCPIKDNPSCSNPKHLWLGTNRENIIDGCRKNGKRVMEDYISPFGDKESEIWSAVLKKNYKHPFKL